MISPALEIDIVKKHTLANRETDNNSDVNEYNALPHIRIKGFFSS